MNETLYEALATRAGTGDGGPLLLLPDRDVSAGELLARADALAAALHRRGAGAGDRVALLLRRGLDAAAAVFAVARLGAAAVHLYEGWRAAHLAAAIEKTSPKLVLADRALAAALDGIDGDVLVAEEAPPAAPPLAPRGTGADLGAALFTSGSTGWPRPAALSHETLLAGACRILQHQAVGPEDRLLWLFPLSFIYGLNHLHTALLTGGALVLDPSPFFPDVMAIARRRRVTVLPGTPETFAALDRLAAEGPLDLPDLRQVVNSGGPIPRARLDRLPGILPGVAIHLTYGFTEANRVTALPPERFAEKRGSIGRPLPGITTLVVDSEGRPVRPGEEGELLVSSDTLFDGYLGDPEATAERVRAIPGDVRRFVASGDLVREDADGDLWFAGRKTDFLKCQGIRVSVTEIEDLALGSGLVRAVAAVGVPDDRRGQVVHLAVTGGDGPEPDVRELLAWCRKEMPPPLVPAAIHVFPGDLPRLRAGKPDRREIAAAIHARLGGC